MYGKLKPRLDSEQRVVSSFCISWIFSEFPYCAHSFTQTSSAHGLSARFTHASSARAEGTI